MYRKGVYIAAIWLMVVLLGACKTDREKIDGQRRAHADELNKLSFQQRFKDASLAEYYARQSLSYIQDSLSEYEDGRLRAWNNLATIYFLQSNTDSAYQYIDIILNSEAKSKNREKEQLLARLLEARLLQRNCDIVGSSQILYDIVQSKALKKQEGDWLYSLAKSEFYITSALLNYDNRIEAQHVSSEILTEMASWKPNLRCDFAEDMSFNYALAYGYARLCGESAEQSDNLRMALTYCRENLMLMQDSARVSTYHLGNTFTVLGFIFGNRKIEETSWTENESLCEQISEMVWGEEVSIEEERQALSLAFFDEAALLFARHDDPYQLLGALVIAGRRHYREGDLEGAQHYLQKALNDSTLIGVSPKYEERLYEMLLLTGCAENNEEVAAWTEQMVALQTYINQSEQADFALQTQYAQMVRNNRQYVVITIALSVLVVALIVVSLLLRRRSKELDRKTKRLQQAKERDIERIANVETCMSVLRHDVSPFIAYLRNENLPEELRREVTSQLVRTFENIKSWTNLSIPKGLRFNSKRVDLQEVFDHTKGCINNFNKEQVTIQFKPTEQKVRGDEHLIEILLRNIVNNAVQNTERGIIEIAAQSYREDKRFVVLSVRDTGKGMSEEEVESLFRADKNIAKGDTKEGYGTGFGLLLCKYIIKLHDDNTIRGCRIWVESIEGEGTTFYVLLERCA